MVHRLERSIRLKITLDQAWDFFSDPRNLEIITPPSLGIRIVNEIPEKMYPGAIIVYTVRPILSIPLLWVTEITHVVEGERFVDEQRRGPYLLWHHEHTFRAVPGGVEVNDLVHYLLPFGPLGELVHSLFVNSQLRRIFDHRTEVLTKRFGRID